MADEEQDIGRAHVDTRALLDVLATLALVARGELAKGPGLASNAWADMLDVLAPLIGDAPTGRAVPVREHQPLVMPPGYEHPIPPKGGAQPLIKPVDDIRSRGDVAAELERVKKGGK
jgi:hypothetical protein